jgi:hypothetical protein
MNDQPLTEILLWGLHRQFLEFLMIGLLVAVAMHAVAMLILIFCLCREATRANRKKAGTDERVPLEAGAPVETLNVEPPTWNIEHARFGPELEVAAHGR